MFVVLLLFAVPLTLTAGTQYRVRDGVFAQLGAPLALGSHLTIHAVPLADDKDSDLELEPFDVRAKGAKIFVYTDHGVVILNPTPDSLFCFFIFMYPT